MHRVRTVVFEGVSNKMVKFTSGKVASQEKIFFKWKSGLISAYRILKISKTPVSEFYKISKNQKYSEYIGPLAVMSRLSCEKISDLALVFGERSW